MVSIPYMGKEAMEKGGHKMDKFLKEYHGHVSIPYMGKEGMYFKRRIERCCTI